MTPIFLRTTIRVAPIAAFLLACIGPAAQAQGLTGCNQMPDEFEGRDIRSLSVEQGLDALVAYELDINGAEDALARAVAASDPALIPRLKAVVEGYTCIPTIPQLALTALRLSGEPADYFLGLVDRGLATPGPQGKLGLIGYDALAALAHRPERELYPVVRPYFSWDLGIRPLASIAPAYEMNLAREGVYVDGSIRDLSHIVPTSIQERAYDEASLFVAGLLSAAVFDVAADTLYLSEFIAYESAISGRLVRLRQLASTNPTAVADAFARVRNDYASGQVVPNVFVADPDNSDAQPEDLSIAQIMEAFAAAEATVDAALPPLARPSSDPSSVVTPGEVCIAEEGPWRFAAFSYTVSGPGPAVLVHGLSNWLTALDGNQPEVYEGGVGGGVWRLPLLDGVEAVTWTVQGQSVAADADTRRCGEPDPVPVCQDPEATVYVSASGLIVGGPDAGQPYTGTLTGTAGADVMVGTAGDDTILALAGDDVLCGLDGDDTLDGGLGTDRIDGGEGSDACYGAVEANCERS